MRIKAIFTAIVIVLLAVFLTACKEVKYSHVVYEVQVDGETYLVLEGEKVPFGTPFHADENKIFVGWVESNEPFDANTAVYSNLTITSQWRDRETYQVTIGDEVIEVTEGELLMEPEVPTQAGKVFVEWQKNGVVYDFTQPVTASFTLVALWQETKIIVISGQIIGLDEGVGSVSISVNDDALVTDEAGYFSISLLHKQLYLLTIEKDGYETKVIEVDLRNISGNTYDLGEISLSKAYAYFGTVGGNLTPAWDFYQTRDANGITFKASADMGQSSIIDGNHAVGFMVYVGDVSGRTTRNHTTFLFEYYVSGRLSLHNYPNNIKRAFTQSFDVETEIIVDLETGIIDLIVFVPYTYFSNQVPQVNVGKYDTLGVSGYSYDSSDGRTETLRYQDQTISFSNPSNYLRATHFNQILVYPENMDTLISGTVESQNVYVYVGDVLVSVASNGAFTYAFRRQDLASVTIRFESDAHQTKEIDLTLNDQALFDLGDVLLDVIESEVTITIIDEVTDLYLDGVEVTYKDVVYTSEDGVVSLSVPMNEQLNITITKSGYYTQNLIYSVNQINTPEFNPTVYLITEDQTPRATIHGSISDAFGPIAAVKVELIDGEDIVEVQTDHLGFYQFNQIDIKDYQIRVTYLGDITVTSQVSESELLDAPSNTLDLNFLRYVDLGTIGGGSHQTPPMKWHVVVTRDVEGFKFKFIAEGIADNTTTNRDFIEIYMHMGFENFDNHTTIAHENMYAFNFRFDGDNVWRQIFNYPSTAKTAIRNDTNSGNAGVTVVSSVIEGVSVLDIVIPYTAFANLGGHSVDINTEIPMSMLAYRNNGGTEPWYRPDLEGYVGNNGEVVRSNMLDNLFVNKYQELYDFDHSAYYSQEAISERFSETEDYQEGYELFSNLAQVSVVGGSMEVLELDTLVFNDRANFRFNQYVLPSLQGLEFSHASIDGSEIIIEQSGYIIVVADDLLHDDILAQGFTLIARRQIAIATSERVSYYVKWVAEGETINLGKWSFFIAESVLLD